MQGRRIILLFGLAGCVAATGEVGEDVPSYTPQGLDEEDKLGLSWLCGAACDGFDMHKAKDGAKLTSGTCSESTVYWDCKRADGAVSYDTCPRSGQQRLSTSLFDALNDNFPICVGEAASAAGYEGDIAGIEINNGGGIINQRQARGSTRWSMHAFGRAIDLNGVTLYPEGKTYSYADFVSAGEASNFDDPDYEFWNALRLCWGRRLYSWLGRVAVNQGWDLGAWLTRNSIGVYNTVRETDVNPPDWATRTQYIGSISYDDDPTDGLHRDHMHLSVPMGPIGMVRCDAIPE